MRVNYQALEQNAPHPFPFDFYSECETPIEEERIKSDEIKMKSRHEPVQPPKRSSRRENQHRNWISGKDIRAKWPDEEQERVGAASRRPRNIILAPCSLWFQFIPLLTPIRGPVEVSALLESVAGRVMGRVSKAGRQKSGNYLNPWQKSSRKVI